MASQTQIVQTLFQKTARRTGIEWHEGASIFFMCAELLCQVPNASYKKWNSKQLLSQVVEQKIEQIKIEDLQLQLHVYIFGRSNMKHTHTKKCQSKQQL